MRCRVKRGSIRIDLSESSAATKQVVSHCQPLALRFWWRGGWQPNCTALGAWKGHICLLAGFTHIIPTESMVWIKHLNRIFLDDEVWKSNDLSSWDKMFNNCQSGCKVHSHSDHLPQLDELNSISKNNIWAFLSSGHKTFSPKWPNNQPYWTGGEQSHRCSLAADGLLRLISVGAQCHLVMKPPYNISLDLRPSRAFRDADSTSF